MTPRSQESHYRKFVNYSSMTLGMLGMSSITFLQAFHHKNLVIVAETCEPFELGAAAIYGRLAVKHVRAAIDEPIPGQNTRRLTPETMPDMRTLAAQIGLEG